MIRPAIIAAGLILLLGGFPWYGPHLYPLFDRPLEMRPFSLLDADTGEAFRYPDGHAYLLYFGFLGCRSSCPVALAEMSAFLKQEHVARCGAPRLLFASVDPRDRQERKSKRSRLGEIVLVDGEDAVFDLAQFLGTRYRLPPSAELADPQTQIDHPDVVFLLDRAGQKVAMVTPVRVDTLQAAWQRMLPLCTSDSQE